MKSRTAIGWTLAILTLWAGLLAVTVAQDAGETGDEAVEETEVEAVSPARAAMREIMRPDTPSGKLGAILLITLVTYVVYVVVVRSLRKAMRIAEEKSLALPGVARDRQQRAVTIMSLATNIVRWALSLLWLIWVLGALGINLLPLLTGVGFMGAAIAFGSQTLVRDVVTGFFVLLEGQYAVGDYVELNGKFGMVQTVGLRATVLKDIDNQLHHIPNGTITASTVYEEHFVSHVLHVPIAAAEDARRAGDLVHRAAQNTMAQLPRHLLSVDAPIIEASEDGVSEVKIAFDVFPTQEWMATTELPNRMKFILAKHEIAAPDGMAPHSEADLSRMPVVPLLECEEDGSDGDIDLVARWRQWTGTPASEDDADASEPQDA